MLQRLGEEVGLPPDEVRDDERTAGALGISAVPFFVVDRSFGAPGAQPPEVLAGLLRRAMEARPRLASTAADLG